VFEVVVLSTDAGAIGCARDCSSCSDVIRQHQRKQSNWHRNEVRRHVVIVIHVVRP
jgi:hypothetical protein